MNKIRDYVNKKAPISPLEILPYTTNFLFNMLPFDLHLHLRRFWYMLIGHRGIGDPRRIYYVSPTEINHHIQSDVIDNPLFPFAIYDGDWHNNVREIDDLPTYDMFMKHFEGNVPWEKTVQYKRFIQKIQEGSSLGVLDVPVVEQSVPLYHKYLSYMDDLYCSIKSNGYKRQSEISNDSDFLNRELPPYRNEIQVFIGPNGEIICRSGVHRLIISKILGIDEVPVRTAVRHKRWQIIRDEFASASTYCELSDRAKSQMPHPELDDLQT